MAPLNGSLGRGLKSTLSSGPIAPTSSRASCPRAVKRRRPPDRHRTRGRPAARALRYDKERLEGRCCSWLMVGSSCHSSILPLRRLRHLRRCGATPEWKLLNTAPLTHRPPRPGPWPYRQPPRGADRPRRGPGPTACVTGGRLRQLLILN